MLFQTFHGRGLVPIYVRGSDVKGFAEKDIDGAIRKAVIEQYGVQCVESSNRPRARRRSCSDDFDDGRKAPIQRARVLAFVGSAVPQICVTANESLTLMGQFSHAEDALKDLNDYKFLPMGFSLRARLVKRWFQRTSSDGTLDEDALLARCDQAERLLDAVLARNIVPSLPLYLLTLLQATTLGHRADSKKAVSASTTTSWSRRPKDGRCRKAKLGVGD